MSYEPSRTTTKNQPSVEPSKARTKVFNSAEMARIMAIELGLNGRDMMLLCQDSIEAGQRKWNSDAEVSQQRIMSRWRDYQEADVGFKTGIMKFLKFSKFAETDEEWGNGEGQQRKRSAGDRYSAALRGANAPHGEQLEKP